MSFCPILVEHAEIPTVLTSSCWFGKRFLEMVSTASTVLVVLATMACAGCVPLNYATARMYQELTVGDLIRVLMARLHGRHSGAVPRSKPKTGKPTIYGFTRSKK